MTSPRRDASQVGTSVRLEEAIRKAPEVLSDQMKKTLEDLSKGLPEAKSGDVLSSKVSW